MADIARMSAPRLRAGQIFTGPLYSEPMRVETVRENGPETWEVGLVGTQSEQFRKVTLTRHELESLTILDAQHTFDADDRGEQPGVVHNRS